MFMKHIQFYIATIFFLSVFSCQPEHEVSIPERGHDPWVIRSVLDGQARMLTLALADGFWAAYSAEDGQLYKVWKGSVNFDGAVYTTVHGPQPSSLGDAFFENKIANPWKLLQGEKASVPAIEYKGHRFEKDQVWVNYELKFDGGKTIRVSERPEYLSAAEGRQDGYHRLFRAQGLPDDAKLQYTFNYHSIPAKSSIQTSGQLEIIEDKGVELKGLKAHDITANLILNEKGDTYLNAYFTKYPLIANENQVKGMASTTSTEPLGARLIARSDCKTCHNAMVKTIGPAYVEVAKRYRNTEENIGMLIGKIKNGGSGNWGEAVMTAHPDLDDVTARAMVKYIMNLDAEEEALLAEEVSFDADLSQLVSADPAIKAEELLPGLFLRIYQYDRPLISLKNIPFSGKPAYEGHLPNVHVPTSDFKGLEDNFAFRYQGYINIPKDNNYVFRLTSDDGSRLFIGDRLVVDYDGLHGAGDKDGEIALSAGIHPIRVEYFQGLGGKYLSLKWKSFDDKEFTIIPKESFMHHRDARPATDASAPPMVQVTKVPGDGFPVSGVHPSFTLTQARPQDFLPKVGGMDFLSDGRMVVSTWDAEGAIFVLDNVETGDPSKITYTKVAKGLAEPLGLKVVDDTIYVLQKQELTKLIDHDGDGIIDEYQTVSNDWKVSANFHEFAFGLAYKKGYFYAALAIAILPGGASANPQIPDRGKAIKINKNTGEVEFIASGLRTPNGVGIGVDEEIFIADNQGDWLPSSKILHVKEGDFFGSRAVDSARVAALPVKRPVVWLPQDEIGNSPTTPAFLEKGPYAGQMIHGEVTHGGVKRVFVEKVGGEYQGAVFRFIQGLEAGVNRIVWGPDGALYIGGVGSTGNWSHSGKAWYGLQRLAYNETTAFEMLAVRARSNGLEVEFTEPLPENVGWDPLEYDIQQWWYLPTNEYGGPKKDLEKLKVLSASVSDDRKKVFLELEGMKEGHVLYVHLPYDWTSENGNEIWSTEAWYTMNRIPTGNPGVVRNDYEPLAPNTLSSAEKADGWELLFDGETTNGWRNYKKETIGSSWKVVDGTLMLDAKKRDDGSWQAADGGDIITDGTYENYDLRLEWKIGPCGNSGIIFNTVEAEEFDYVWQTGPEMQILDNTCHPDAQYETHRAGCLYDMLTPKYETVKPAGQWNKVRIRNKDGKVKFWLNGRQIVNFEMFTPEWNKMIANSKFREMESFGQSRVGHIALQDHGDPVWFRNIKIKEL
jgi:cytochrome c